MVIIKKLGRKEGWRSGAVLASLDKPIRLSVDGKTRQTKRVVLCQGYMYPVNRKEQIVGEPIASQS